MGIQCKPGNNTDNGVAWLLSVIIFVNKKSNKKVFLMTRFLFEKIQFIPVNRQLITILSSIQ